ncbi:hypothetical protein QBC34DRAFT_499274 [Podospora aff. communis PSN243]|uniref:Uncharacterized protein n=1 Tax=Podospora aff. communis PSN243 TaxID=3040156 RepID=A0AAV9G4F6_9PEZI|nr:hypothetical protein QBC34DRAFT_499274 [Podospora aff. communis PSN243]
MKAGLLWVPGKCICGPQLEIGEVILDVVMEGLAKLEEVICATMLSTLELFVQSALDFIPVTAPVGAALTAARVVQGAKTFVENGVEAASFFGDWIGPTCKIPEFKFDITSVFTNIVGSSDGIGTSVGCLKMNKAECSKPKPVPTKENPSPPTVAPNPDPPKPEPPKPADPTKVEPPKPSKPDPTSVPDQTAAPPITSVPPATTGPPAGTSRDVSSTSSISSISSVSSVSSSASACKIARRAVNPDGKYLGKVGDTLVSTECVNGVTTIHSTITKKPIGSYPHTVAKKCSQQWAQACYHYRSVMSVAANANPPLTDMIRWTCSETKGTSKKGAATGSWGSSAIGRVGKAQQWFPWANGFVPRDPDTGKGYKRIYKRVRFIPAAENGGAGSMFKEFCVNNAAAVPKAKAPGGQDLVDPQFIVTKEQNSRTDLAKGNDPATVFTTVSVQTAHAVFEIKDWDNLPADPEFHGLKLNPCWPRMLAPEDPGFVLLTNDEFYLTQHTTLTDYTARYTTYPDLQVLINAMVGIDQIRYDELFGNDPIPDEYLKVLPGMPRPGQPNVPSPPNTPDPDSDSGSDADGEFELERRANGTVQDAGNRENGRLWMRAYRAWLRQQQESSNIVAPRTDAKPTLLSQDAPTVTPATPRSYVGSGMPLVTRAVVPN